MSLPDGFTFEENDVEKVLSCSDRDAISTPSPFTFKIADYFSVCVDEHVFIVFTTTSGIQIEINLDADKGLTSITQEKVK